MTISYVPIEARNPFMSAIATLAGLSGPSLVQGLDKLIVWWTGTSSSATDAGSSDPVLAWAISNISVHEFTDEIDGAGRRRIFSEGGGLCSAYLAHGDGERLRYEPPLGDGNYQNGPESVVDLVVGAFFEGIQFWPVNGDEFEPEMDWLSEGESLPTDEFLVWRGRYFGPQSDSQLSAWVFEDRLFLQFMGESIWISAPTE
jgi:hypothetical protein